MKGRIVSYDHLQRQPQMDTSDNSAINLKFLKNIESLVMLMTVMMVMSRMTATFTTLDMVLSQDGMSENAVTHRTMLQQHQFNFHLTYTTMLHNCKT